MAATRFSLHRLQDSFPCCMVWKFCEKHSPGSALHLIFLEDWSPSLHPPFQKTSPFQLPKSGFPSGQQQGGRSCEVTRERKLTVTSHSYGRFLQLRVCLTLCSARKPIFLLAPESVGGGALFRLAWRTAGAGGLNTVFFTLGPFCQLTFHWPNVLFIHVLSKDKHQNVFKENIQLDVLLILLVFPTLHILGASQP